jgi:hypothetical protein
MALTENSTEPDPAAEPRDPGGRPRNDPPPEEKGEAAFMAGLEARAAIRREKFRVRQVKRRARKEAARLAAGGAPRPERRRFTLNAYARKDGTRPEREIPEPADLAPGPAPAVLAIPDPNPRCPACLLPPAACDEQRSRLKAPSSGEFRDWRREREPEPPDAGWLFLHRADPDVIKARSTLWTRTMNESIRRTNGGLR